MEERAPIWRVAVNTVNKQSQTDNMGWYLSLGVRDVLTIPHHKAMLRNIHNCLGLGLILWTI